MRDPYHGFGQDQRKLPTQTAAIGSLWFPHLVIRSSPSVDLKIVQQLALETRRRRKEALKSSSRANSAGVRVEHRARQSEGGDDMGKGAIADLINDVRVATWSNDILQYEEDSDSDMESKSKPQSARGRAVFVLRNQETNLRIVKGDEVEIETPSTSLHELSDENEIIKPHDSDRFIMTGSKSRMTNSQQQADTGSQTKTTRTPTPLKTPSPIIHRQTSTPTTNNKSLKIYGNARISDPTRFFKPQAESLIVRYKRAISNQTLSSQPSKLDKYGSTSEKEGDNHAYDHTYTSSTAPTKPLLEHPTFHSFDLTEEAIEVLGRTPEQDQLYSSWQSIAAGGSMATLNHENGVEDYESSRHSLASHGARRARHSESLKRQASVGGWMTHDRSGGNTPVGISRTSSIASNITSRSKSVVRSVSHGEVMPRDHGREQASQEHEKGHVQASPVQKPSEYNHALEPPELESPEKIRHGSISGNRVRISLVPTLLDDDDDRVNMKLREVKSGGVLKPSLSLAESHGPPANTAPSSSQVGYISAEEPIIAAGTVAKEILTYPIDEGGVPSSSRRRESSVTRPSIVHNDTCRSCGLSPNIHQHKCIYKSGNVTVTKVSISEGTTDKPETIEILEKVVSKVRISTSALPRSKHSRSPSPCSRLTTGGEIGKHAVKNATAINKGRLRSQSQPPRPRSGSTSIQCRPRKGSQTLNWSALLKPSRSFLSSGHGLDNSNLQSNTTSNSYGDLLDADGKIHRYIEIDWDHISESSGGPICRGDKSCTCSRCSRRFSRRGSGSRSRSRSNSATRRNHHLRKEISSSLSSDSLTSTNIPTEPSTINPSNPNTTISPRFDISAASSMTDVQVTASQQGTLPVSSRSPSRQPSFVVTTATTSTDSSQASISQQNHQPTTTIATTTNPTTSSCQPESRSRSPSLLANSSTPGQPILTRKMSTTAGQHGVGRVASQSQSQSQPQSQLAFEEAKLIQSLDRLEMALGSKMRVLNKNN
ncbi:hypothetical protein HDU76_010149 [Blyttiomyces sp. JEL0837]|nr:hypothetical protein HDU76_010149 [Blyttiomyces sp. JEL0837]